MRVTQKYYDKKLEEEIKWITQMIHNCASRGIDEINEHEIKGWAESNLEQRRIFVKAVDSVQKENKDE